MLHKTVGGSCVATHWRVQMIARRCRGLCKWKGATFPNLFSATCTKHPADVIRLLRAACALSAPTHIPEVCAMAAWRWGAVCRGTSPVSEKLNFIFFSKNWTIIFSKLTSVTCAKPPADVARLLRAACALSAFTHFTELRAIVAWRCGALCWWAGPISEKLKFNSFSESWTSYRPWYLQN